MENIRVLGRNDPTFLCIFIITHWYLTPQSRFVTAHLAIPFPHCGSLQEVRTFQNRVFPIFLFNCQHGGLNFLFFFQLAGVGKEIELVKTFVLYNPVRANCDPANQQFRIRDSVKQLTGCFCYCTLQEGRRIQPNGTVRPLWELCGRNGRYGQSRGKSHCRSSRGHSQRPSSKNP